MYIAPVVATTRPCKTKSYVPTPTYMHPLNYAFTNLGMHSSTGTANGGNRPGVPSYLSAPYVHTIVLGRVGYKNGRF